MKKIICLITAILITLNITYISVSAFEYNENYLTDGEFNGTLDFKYNYINIGNLVVMPGQFVGAPASDTDLAAKKEVRQYTDDDGNKYIGIRIDKNAKNSQMVELDFKSYLHNSEELREDTLYKMSIRIKVPEVSLAGTSGEAMLIPNKENNAYDPILCDKFGIPTDLYPNGNVADKRGEFLSMTGYTQKLTADEWTTVETYYKISSTGISGKNFSASLRTDTNRIKDFEFYIDDFRLEAVNQSIEPLGIKSADGNESFEVEIPGEAEERAVYSYSVELKVNGSEIYDDKELKFASLSLPENNNYKGVAIEDNRLTVFPDAVYSTVRLIAATADGKSVYRDVTLVPKSSIPKVRNLKIYKENGRVKYSYTFYDPYGAAEGESEIRWLYSQKRDGSYDYITPPEDFENSEYSDGYLKVEVKPINIDGASGISVMSGSIRVSDTAPTASDIKLIGNYYQNEVISVDYKYDSENLYDERDTSIVWYGSDKMYGEYERLDNSNSREYRLRETDVGKYIKCTVTPKSDTPVLTGKTYSSCAYGPVKEKADSFSDYSPDYFEGENNLIEDSSFENDSVEKVRVIKDGRYVNSCVYSSASLSSDEELPMSMSDESFDGNKSIKINATTISCAMFECTVESGKLYTFSAWVKCAAGNDGDNNALKISLQAKEGGKESNNVRIMNADYSKAFSALSRPPVNGETTYNVCDTISDKLWTKVTRIFYITANDDGSKRQLRVSLGLVPKSGSTEYYIDDVYIGEAAESAYSLNFDLCEDTIYSESEQSVNEYCNAVLKCGDNIYKNQKYTYSLTEAPEGVTINESSGELTVAPGVKGNVEVEAVCSMDSEGILFHARKNILIEQYNNVYVDGIYLDGKLADGFDRSRENYFIRVDSLSDIPEITITADKSFAVSTTVEEYENYKVYAVKSEYCGAVKNYNVCFYTISHEYENIFPYGDFENGYRYFNKAGTEVEENIVHRGNYSAKLSSLSYQNVPEGLTVRLHRGRKYLFDAWIYISDNSNLYFYMNNVDPMSENKAYFYDDEFNIREGRSEVSKTLSSKKYEKGKWININKIIWSEGDSELCTFAFGYATNNGASNVYIDDVYVAELKDSAVIGKIIGSENAVDGYTAIQYETDDETMVYTVLKTDGDVLDDVSLIAAEYDKNTGGFIKIPMVKSYSDGGFYILKIPSNKDNKLKTFLWTGLNTMLPLPYNP